MSAVHRHHRSLAPAGAPPTLPPSPAGASTFVDVELLDDGCAALRGRARATRSGTTLRGLTLAQLAARRTVRARADVATADELAGGGRLRTVVELVDGEARLAAPPRVGAGR